MNNEDEELENEIEESSPKESSVLEVPDFVEAENSETDNVSFTEPDFVEEIPIIEQKVKPVKPALHISLTSERRVLIVDEAGDRRNETIEIIKQVLLNAEIHTADSPELAQREIEKVVYDTCVVNFLMPGYSSSDFVKTIANNPAHPLLVGFSADKMSDAYDPKKGIKIKPLRRIFEIDTLKEDEASTKEDDI